MSLLDFGSTPHRRWNPLLREWVLVSPQRSERPWQGQVEKSSLAQRLQYDPQCYLCPGNARAGGHKNPDYTSTFVFENDYAALRPATPSGEWNQSDLIVGKTERGICRVICFSPRHDLTISNMELSDLTKVVDVLGEQYRELGAIDWVKHVQIFENRGEMMGASNPHPHCQIWATRSIPQAPARELSAQQGYFQKHGNCLLCDYMKLEEMEKSRIVCSNESFVVLVPFWAVWPFEVLVCSRRHVGTLPEINNNETAQLAAILKQIVSTYDRVFEVAFPYSMGFHQSPTTGSHREWHFHAHFYPPLLRSATVRKFMVGFEMLGTPQRDITPELAAEKLRSLTANPK